MVSIPYYTYRVIKGFPTTIVIDCLSRIEGIANNHYQPIIGNRIAIKCINNI